MPNFLSLLQLMTDYLYKHKQHMKKHKEYPSLEYATGHSVSPDTFIGNGKCWFKSIQAIKETKQGFPASGCISPS